MNYIVKNNTSKYNIITPQIFDERVEFAAKELQNFINLATGVELRISNDVDINGIFLCVEPNCNDGYRVYSKDNDIYIVGNSIHGLIYGVYGFLKNFIGLEFFSPEVYTFNKGDIVFKSVDFSRIPDIPLRAAGIWPVHDETPENPLLPFVFRMGLRGMADGWGLTGHSYFKILPPEIYRDSHPTWYSTGDDGKNLCLTNEEMREEFVLRVIEIINNAPNATYFMLGQPDTNTFCNCENCQKELQKYNGFNSVIMINFTNYVVQKVNAHFKKVNPNRKIHFVMFAYQTTVRPPVEVVGGKYKTLFGLKLEENLSIMLAPLSTRSDLSFFDKQNRISFDTKYNSEKSEVVRSIIDGWKVLSKKLFLWTYHVDYVNYFLPFNNWDSIEENYQEYKKLGVFYLFEEGAYQKYVPNFNALKLYVYSNFMWNCNSNLNSLIDKFMLNYYGEKAAPHMREYFDYINEYLRVLVKDSGRPMLHIRFDDFEDLHVKKFWSQEFADGAFMLFKRALNAANGEYYQRVKEDGAPIFWLYVFTGFEIEQTNLQFMKESFKEITQKYELFEPLEGIPSGALKKLFD